MVKLGLEPRASRCIMGSWWKQSFGVCPAARIGGTPGKDDNGPGSANWHGKAIAYVALPTLRRHQNNTASSLLVAFLSLSPLNKLHHTHHSLSRFLLL